MAYDVLRLLEGGAGQVGFAVFPSLTHDISPQPVTHMRGVPSQHPGLGWNGRRGTGDVRDTRLSCPNIAFYGQNGLWSNCESKIGFKINV